MAQEGVGEAWGNIGGESEVASTKAATTKPERNAPGATISPRACKALEMSSCGERVKMSARSAFSWTSAGVSSSVT